MTQIILETERLLLRELVPGDLDFVATMLADPEVTRFYPKAFDRRGSQTWLNRQLERYQRDGHGLWLVFERATGSPVGQVGLTNQEVEGTHEPEVGYLLHRPFWGRGYATEAACATRDLAFSRWSYPRVISLVRPENEPSLRVAKRVGMLPERRVQFAGFEHILLSTSSPAEHAA